MFKIAYKKQLNPEVVEMDIYAPRIAKKRRPGQFIIFRIDELGERVPLTIAGSDPEKGTVKIIFQTVGASTRRLGMLEAGDEIHDFVGPLGKASELDEYVGRRVAVVAGGLGTAIAYPQAQYLHEIGAEVHLICGFRNKSLLLLEDQLKAASSQLYICTDDGSYGEHGFVTNVLARLIKGGMDFDLVIAVGPLIMMQKISELTEPYNIPTLVSMNTIMVDGTGMCGCCRVTVGGETRFACVDGPDFDGHKVDYAEAMRRSRLYRPQEASDLAHKCTLTGEVRHG